MSMSPKKVLQQYTRKRSGYYSELALKKNLEELYCGQQLEPHSIIRMIFKETQVRISAHAVRYWLKKLGVPMRSTRPKMIGSAISSCGFKDMEEYFLARSTASLVSMADELDVSLSGIQRAHSEFVKKYGDIDEGNLPGRRNGRKKRP